MSEELVVAAGDSSAMADVASPLELLEVLAAASRKESPPLPSSTSLAVAVAAATAVVDMAVEVYELATQPKVTSWLFAFCFMS